MSCGSNPDQWEGCAALSWEQFSPSRLSYGDSQIQICLAVQWTWVSRAGLQVGVEIQEGGNHLVGKLTQPSSPCAWQRPPSLCPAATATPPGLPASLGLKATYIIHFYINRHISQDGGKKKKLFKASALIMILPDHNRNFINLRFTIHLLIIHLPF